MHFVAEHRDARGLEPYHRDAASNGIIELVQRSSQDALGGVDHPEIVERASAADVFGGDNHVEPGFLQHLGGRQRRVGEEVIVERIGPEHHVRFSDVAGRALAPK